MSDWVTALFGLGGVLVGSVTTVGVEFFRRRGEARLKARQVLAEQCAKFLNTAQTLAKCGMIKGAYDQAGSVVSQRESYLDVYMNLIDAQYEADLATVQLELLGPIELSKSAKTMIDVLKKRIWVDQETKRNPGDYSSAYEQTQVAFVRRARDYLKLPIGPPAIPPADARQAREGGPDVGGEK